MRYTENETALCAYASLYDLDEIGGIDAIYSSTGRNKDSIKMKVQNIAAVLDEEGISRNQNMSALSGKTTREAGRRTDWEIIKLLARQSRESLLKRCLEIVERARSV